MSNIHGLGDQAECRSLPSGFHALLVLNALLVFLAITKRVRAVGTV